jgi:hypothetical protein
VELGIKFEITGASIGTIPRTQIRGATIRSERGLVRPISTLTRLVKGFAIRSLYCVKNFFVDLTDLAYPFNAFPMRKIENLCQTPVHMVRDKSHFFSYANHWIGHGHPPGPGSSGGRFSSP